MDGHTLILCNAVMVTPCVTPVQAPLDHLMKCLCSCFFNSSHLEQNSNKQPGMNAKTNPKPHCTGTSAPLAPCQQHAHSHAQSKHTHRQPPPIPMPPPHPSPQTHTEGAFIFTLASCSTNASWRRATASCTRCVCRLANSSGASI